MLKISRNKQVAYEQAVLFRKRGFTYSEIAKICNVSRGTVCNWLRHEAFSQAIAKDNIAKAVRDNTKRLALINKTRATDRKRQYTEAIRQALTEFKHYRHNSLFIAGLTLYLATGDTTSPNTLRLTSSRPELHRLLISFVVEFLGIEKPAIRIWLLLYPDLDAVTCMKYWCKQTRLSPAQFHKNQVVEGRASGKNKHFGVATTVVSDTVRKKKLQTWLTLLQKEIKI
jgi:AcrR family transcriptional regulator